MHESTYGSVCSVAAHTCPYCLAAQPSSSGPAPRGPMQAFVALSLLKHLVYKSSPAKQLLARDGLVTALRALWPAAAAATSGPVFHELLGCITNCLPDCPEARARFATEGGDGRGPGTLLGSLVGIMFTVSRRSPVGPKAGGGHHATGQCYTGLWGGRLIEHGVVGRMAH